LLGKLTISKEGKVSTRDDCNSNVELKASQPIELGLQHDDIVYAIQCVLQELGQIKENSKVLAEARKGSATTRAEGALPGFMNIHPLNDVTESMNTSSLTSVQFAVRHPQATGFTL
jgi:hypothetical protein